MKNDEREAPAKLLGVCRGGTTVLEGLGDTLKEEMTVDRFDEIPLYVVLR